MTVEMTTTPAHDGYQRPDGAAQCRLVVVDDCRLRRERVVDFLARSGAEAGSAWDTRSLEEEFRRSRPDVIVLSMSSHSAQALMLRSVQLCGADRVIVFSLTEDDEDTIMKCVEAGVAGYHLRSESLDDLLAAIVNVHRGKPACSQRVSAVLLRRMSDLASRRPTGHESPLTAREEEILDMLGMGLSNREIADRLCIAVHTVKNHVHNLLTKLGVRSRAEAAARYRNGYSDDAVRHISLSFGSRATLQA